jgi:flagellar hook-associated protein 3 FlgL
MRITSGMISRSTLRNIEANQTRTEELQNQITSGSRITRPSDDPIGAARALSLQDGLSQSQQYLKNIDQALSFINTSDAALDSVTQALGRGRELGVQAANGTLSASDRAAIQSEIEQIQSHVLDLAGSKYGAYYLFSGTASSEPGYVKAAPSSVSGAYQGTDASVVREISPGASMAVNADARKTFDPTFQALQSLRDGLANNDQNAIQTSLTQLDTALDAVNSTRAELGAKSNRLEFVQQRQESVGVNLTELLSNVKDVDMAEALVNFQMAQNVYSASLKAGAQAMQPSLLDYLR